MIKVLIAAIRREFMRGNQSMEVTSFAVEIGRGRGPTFLYL
jgi:hypothetical protein